MGARGQGGGRRNSSRLLRRGDRGVCSIRLRCAVKRTRSTAIRQRFLLAALAWSGNACGDLVPCEGKLRAAHGEELELGRLHLRSQLFDDAMVRVGSGESLQGLAVQPDGERVEGLRKY